MYNVIKLRVSKLSNSDDKQVTNTIRSTTNHSTCYEGDCNLLKSSLKGEFLPGVEGVMSSLTPFPDPLHTI